MAAIDDIVPRIRVETLMMNFWAGHTTGFTPDFVQGYRPFGINCQPEDIMLIGEGQLSFSYAYRKMVERSDQGVKLELGSKINRVYRQLSESERGYTVLS